MSVQLCGPGGRIYKPPPGRGRASELARARLLAHGQGARRRGVEDEKRRNLKGPLVKRGNSRCMQNEARRRGRCAEPEERERETGGGEGGGVGLVPVRTPSCVCVCVYALCVWVCNVLIWWYMHEEGFMPSDAFGRAPHCQNTGRPRLPRE